MRRLSVMLLRLSIVVGFYIFHAYNVFGQVKTVKGQVIDENNAPLQNVTITCSIDTLSWSTTEDGKFELVLPEEVYSLIFKYPGMDEAGASIGIEDYLEIRMVPAGSDDLYSLSLEQLMNMQINVTGSNVKNSRETPGIVTVITEDEIRYSGARDMVDILRLVPGFNIGADVDNIKNIGVRGNWGNEGKVLYQIDGQMLNETAYGSMAIGQRFPIDQISKIEIIRGPGSVIYGGIAGLAVINIITKSGEDLNGVSGSFSYGIADVATSRSGGQFSAGQSFNNGINYSISAGYSNGILSNNEEFINEQAIPINYRDSSQVNDKFVNIGMNYKDLNVRFIYDDYRIDRVEATEGKTQFGGTFLGIDYKKDFLNKFSASPSIRWSKAYPWNYIEGKTADFDAYNWVNNRITGNLKLNYEISPSLNLNTGAEYFIDHSRYEQNGEYQVFSDGSTDKKLNNIALFAEGSYKSKLANITLGGRFDNHSSAGSAIVPRIAITKAFEKFHYKALYSGAFKTPVLQNIDLNPDIKPEHISVTELEFGYKLAQNMVASVNLYDIVIKDVIAWIDSLQSYGNYGQSGTRGIEVDYKYKNRFLYFKATYGYYEATKNETDYYIIEDNDKSYLGHPNHKFTINSRFKIGNSFHVNPSFILNSEKYTYLYDQDWNYALKQIDPSFVANLYFEYNNLLTKGLSLGFGIYDLFDSGYVVASGYNNGSGLIPTHGTEFMFKIRYDLKK